MKFLLSIIFVLSLITTNVANAVCSNEDTFDGKASIEYPKSGNVFKKAKATPEMKENTKINAKSKILDAYVNKCLDDRSKVEQYLREKNKIDSQLDKFVTVVRVKEKDNQEKRIYSVKMRGSVNSKIFDTLLYGPGKVKGKGKTRMVALFVARKAMGTDSKIYDDKVTKITKAETGVAGEKSVSSDGTTTAVNKKTTAVAKVQKGGSKVKKTRVRIET